MDGVEAYRQARQLAAELIGSVDDADVSAPTPCGEWNVGELVAALIAKTRLYAAASHTAQDSKDVLESPALGADPAGEYRAVAEAFLQAFADPASRATIMTLPIGEVPGSTVVDIALLDTVLHSWDLARAIDGAVAVDEAVVRRTADAARRLISEELRAAGQFAAPHPVPEGGTALDELVAFAGRDPRWRP